jgi:hypothetical protein
MVVNLPVIPAYASITTPTVILTLIVSYASLFPLHRLIFCVTSLLVHDYIFSGSSTSPDKNLCIMILSSNEAASRFEILLTSSDFPYPSTLHPISPAGSYPFIEDQRYLSRHPLILSLVLFFFQFFSVSLSPYPLAR